MNVAGLLFDTGDVLYDATMWRRWLLQLLSHFGLPTGYPTFYETWQRQYLDDVFRGQRDYWDALRDFLSGSGLSCGQIDEVLAAGHARRRQLEEDVRPFPGVCTTLARLAARGIPMAVVSNSPYPALKLREKLRRLGLGVRFSAVISSYDLGCCVPAPQTFQAALVAMGLAADQVAFVGHDGLELQGAATFGLRTIAFNYDPEAKADVYLERFDQLPGAVIFHTTHLLAG